MNTLILKAAMLFFLCILITSVLAAQPLDTLWTKELDGSGADLELTDDGGFIIGGTKYKEPPGESYFMELIKTNGQGNEIWRNTYGTGYYSGVRAVRQTADDGYIITGHMKVAQRGDSKTFLIKTDKDGNELWTKTYGEDVYSNARDVQKTMDGGYIIVGRIRRPRDDIYVIKTDENGDELWSKIFGGQPNEDAFAVRQTPDGGYIILGKSSTGCDMSMDTNVYLIKTDENGNELWSKIYGGLGDQYGFDIIQTSDGGYIIVGRESHGDGFGDIYLLKIDREGKEEWCRTFGGHLGEMARSVLQTTDGGYLLAGISNTSFATGVANIYLLRTNEKGDSLWSKTYDFGGGEGAHCIRQLPDGGYIVLADKGGNILLMRFGKEGKTNRQN